MNELYLELIMSGDIFIQYEEHDGEEMLNIEYKTKEIAESIDEKDFSQYIAECLLVASLAGFEPPSEYYKIIKAYIESADLNVDDAFSHILGKQND